MTRPLTLALLLAAASAACGDKQDAAPAAGDSTAAAAAPAAAPAATPAPTPSQSATADELADITAYRLTSQNVDRFFAAQRNVTTRIAAMSPEERQAIEDRGNQESDPNQSLDEMVRKIESVPQLNAAIRDAGLSAREYSILTFAMLQAGMAAGIQKMRPNANADSLARAMHANPENVRFMREHEAEITRKQAQLQEESRRLQPSDPDAGDH